MRRRLILSIAALSALTACARETPSARLAVTVSIEPQVWLVEALGGPRVDVAVLVRSGTSPETYQPSDAEVSRLLRSELYFRIGAPFENAPWMQAIRASSRLEVVDTREGIEVRGGDPHVWLSPRRLAVQARTVARALGEHDPGHRADFAARLERVEATLDGLDRRLAERLAPLRGEAFFVFHPAWGYFAGDYGLRQVSVEVEGKEPTDAQLTALRRRMLAEGARVIFVEPQVSGRRAAAVAESVGARVEVLDPLRRDVVVNLEEVAGRLISSRPRAPSP